MLKKMPSKLLWIWLSVVLMLAVIVHGQENAQTRIPDSLEECYRNREIYERDYRLPATINTLIELIRKVEDSPDYTQEIKQVAVGLLHRFRMDGIEHAPGNYQPNVLTYSPSGYQFSKHRLLLTRLIPGNANNFPNGTLSVVERCTLHFLLSSSIERQVRGDESTRCGQLAQYRSSSRLHALELFRKKRSNPPQNNFLCDIEMVSDVDGQRRCKRQPYRKYPGHRVRTTTPKVYVEEDDDDYDNEGEGDDYPEEDLAYDMNPKGRGLIDVASNAVSQCPVENGIIRTTWGAVAAGPLIAGIAAGLVQQNVQTRELIKLTRFNSRNPHRQLVQLSIDNRYAATLAGDLAEVALLQGPSSGGVRVGAAGAWNSTVVPHWYFLSQRERLEMTDAEIRGGIDGLVLGLNIAEWRRQASQLRLSQVLDMYYSNRGIISSNFRSCNRRELFSQVAQPNQLQAQSLAFGTVLDREMQLRVTLSNQNIESFSTGATQSLVEYVSNGLNDVTCDATSALSSAETRSATDIHIFVDATWQFNEVQPAIATLLENIDVNRFGSRFTLYNANDASLIVNTTSSLSDFYMQWNLTSHQTQSSGLNLAAIVKQLRTIGTNLINEEHRLSQAGGRSFISLVVPQLSGVNDENSVMEQLVYLREALPDLHLLFWSAGSLSRVARFVVDQNRDLFQLNAVSLGDSDSSQQIYGYTLPVIQRVQSIPRRIANPRCISDGWKWEQDGWGNNALDQYVEPSSVVFYRVQPNYFFQSGGVIRIQSRFQSQIIVCSSRSVERPRYSNGSQINDNVNCKQLLPQNSYDYELTNACEGHYLIQTCPPIYFSVQAAPQETQSNFQCQEAGCRFPDEIKFSFSLENLGCYSSTTRIVSTLLLIVSSISVHIFMKH